MQHGIHLTDTHNEYFLFSLQYMKFSETSPALPSKVSREIQAEWPWKILMREQFVTPLFPCPTDEKFHTGCCPDPGPGLVPSLLVLQISLALNFMLLGTGICLAMLLLLPVVQTKSGKRGKNHDTYSCYMHRSFTSIYKISSLVHYIHCV